MIRIAIFSDIHGNPYATRAALDAIAVDGQFDTVVMAGDVCLGGSDPAACVDLLRAAGVQALYGNADVFMYAPTAEAPTEFFRAHWPQTMQSARWAAEKIGAERLEWLSALLFELRFSPTDNAADDLLVVHANPVDVYTFINPPEEVQSELFGDVTQPDDDQELAELFVGVQAAVMAYGHFHYTSERYLREMRLVNVSPCSFSDFDPDRRARYSVFTWDGEWRIERKYVEYEHRQEGAALLAGDMPGREEQAKLFE
ncbi:MAG: metallophosphoesterase family protein [Chloroflexi bacterium]|nr:metallophosphoesterase family protein [Chloroflexota bacterium]